MDVAGRTMTPAPCERVDDNRGAAEDLATLLAGAATYLAGLWPERGSYVARLGELRARLVEQRLQIAVLGQFKRGKSTFLMLFSAGRCCRPGFCRLPRCRPLSAGRRNPGLR